MSGIARADRLDIPSQVNSVSQGQGMPVILIHGLAASLHDWDALIPALVSRGYATHALDLLGHGDSPKPAMPAYEMEWIVEHFAAWLESLQLPDSVVLIGHSLGGYVALDYARRFPTKVQGLVLVDPLYSNRQLPSAVRTAYALPAIGAFFTRRTPEWLVRRVIDMTSLFMGHRKGGIHALSEEVRAQTALDYVRTAPAAYSVLKAQLDLTPHLASIAAPTLVVWGERDRTLAPESFEELVRRLPNAIGKSSPTSHVPHQADVAWFNELVLDFLESLQ
ncbi:MAG: alpha/beta fold hydrolase [Anaerolineales bacterium]